MEAKIGEPITFQAFFTSGTSGKTGLSISVKVTHVSTTGVVTVRVTSESATEVDNGIYVYSYTPDTAGDWIALFHTDSNAVNSKDIPATWSVGRLPTPAEIDARLSGRHGSGAWEEPAAQTTPSADTTSATIPEPSGPRAANLGRLWAMIDGYVALGSEPAGGERIAMTVTVRSIRSAEMETPTFNGRQEVDDICLPALQAWIRGYLSSLMITRDKANWQFWQQKKLEYLGADGRSGEFGARLAEARSDLSLHRMGTGFMLEDKYA